MNENNGITFVLWLLTIAASICSGMLAWHITEPESFLGALGFLLVWGILSKVAHFVFFGIVFAIFNNK